MNGFTPVLRVPVCEQDSVAADSAEAVQNKTSVRAAEKQNLPAVQCTVGGLQPYGVTSVMQERKHTGAGNKQGNLRSGFQKFRQTVSFLHDIDHFCLLVHISE